MAFSVNTPEGTRDRLFSECLERRQVQRALTDLFQRRGAVWVRSFEEHREYAYSQEQLTSYLEAAGFTHIAVYADRRFEAPGAGEQRVYFSARKGKIK